MSAFKVTLALIWYSSPLHVLRCSGERERDVVTDPLVQGSRLRSKEPPVVSLTNAELLAALTGRRRCAPSAEPPGLRFAFYGRMSTSSFQDVQTSRAWQRAVSDELIEGVGAVVVEFFDVGVSRRWSWADRPEAAALLAAAADPRREFDAVVVGEYERAFHGDQFREARIMRQMHGRAGFNLLRHRILLP
jgi:hypothetical protein